VLVVVTRVGGVMMPVVDVVHMIAMGDGFVAAAIAVCVRVLLMSDMGQGMLVVVALMRGMRVALVDVVDVTLVLGGGVPALCPVDMVVPGMNSVAGSHVFPLPPAVMQSRPEYPGTYRGKPLVSRSVSAG
jgi:hypothetical protein